MGPATPYKEGPASLVLYIWLVLACISSKKKWVLRLAHSFTTKRKWVITDPGHHLSLVVPSHQGCGSCHAEILQGEEQPLQCSYKKVNFMQLWTLPLLLTITSWLPAQWLAYSRAQKMLNKWIIFRSQVMLQLTIEITWHCSYKQQEPSIFRSKIRT